jgi:hypothetical protein
VVLRSEVGGEQSNGGEVDRTPFEHLQDDGKSTRCPRHCDAVVGLLLGEGQDLPAIGEEGAIAGAQVHVACIQLGEVGDEEGHEATLAGGELLHACDQLRVREAPEGGEEIVTHACL